MRDAKINRTGGVQSYNGGALNGLLSQFAANKKKAVIAAGLVLLMIFMWLRLLGGKGPKSARAAIASPISGQSVDTAAEKFRAVFVELPFVEGRHDTLARDFFRLDGKVFTSDGGVSVVSQNGQGHQIQEVAQGLRLEAISMGTQAEAFINDKLVKVGQTIVVEGSRSYECEVKSITENMVVVKYGEAEIELKLKQPN